MSVLHITEWQLRKLRNFHDNFQYKNIISSLEDDQYLFYLSLYYHIDFFIQKVKDAIPKKAKDRD